MNFLSLIFSKDRALQLDATLRSFFLHCRDAESMHVRVLYTTTSSLHTEQYTELSEEYNKYPFIQFIRELNFRSDLLALLAPFDNVLFLVDDNIFVRNFSLLEVNRSLQRNADALGFSLRLGENITYCYPLDKDQNLPDFQSAGGSVLKYKWTVADYDFGYPLEVSSSVYRIENIMPFLAELPFQNPNTLEAAMNINKTFFQEEKPFLLCYEQSVTFCAPVNIVQTMWPNRTSKNIDYSPIRLAELFDVGYRIDVRHYSNFNPNACHQEVELKLSEPTLSKNKFEVKAEVKIKAKGKDATIAIRADTATEPSVSVIIPCYNQAKYLPFAIESIINQTYKNWECIIISDGSPDNTSEVAKQFIEKYPDCSIKLIEKHNGGPSDARNAGIREAKGTWILPLDADDMFLPDFIKRAINIIKNNPRINLVTANEQAFGPKPHEWIPNEYTPQRILYENTLIYASLYKKELWETAGGYDHSLPWGPEDWNFWIACSKVGIVPARIPEKLFLYRTHPGTSRRDIMNKYKSEVLAMVHTLHPDLYPRERIIADHEIISRSHPDTVAKIDSVISKYPDLPMPYFWRALNREHLGRIDSAISDYRKSLSLSGKNNWQQHERLKLLEEKITLSDLSISTTKHTVVNESHSLISVIIPCYNYGHFLQKAVESVLMQTYTNFEIIIVNDGSTDNTQQVAENLIASNPGHHIRLINQPNSGQPATPRNNGISQAEGQYILCLDADDMIDPAFLKECISVLDATPHMSIACPSKQMFGDDNKFAPPLEYNFELLKHMNIMVTACMFRKKAWEDAGGYDIKISGYEDWDFWISCGENKHCATSVPKAVFFYCVSNTGTGAKHVTDDQQIKAQIVIKHHRIYTPAQILWAKGVIEKDPDIIAVSHKEGIIPSFEELPEGIANRQQTVEMYYNLLQSVLGMSLPEAQVVVKDMLKQAHEESLREGTVNLPKNFGDKLLEKEAEDDNTKLQLTKKREEGVSDSDIRWWWNMDDLERRMTLQFDALLKKTQYLKLIQQSGLREEEASRIIRKNYPVFGLPDETPRSDVEDRPLPYELMERVNTYIENSFRKEPDKLNKAIESSSSLNAFIRREIKRGNI